MNKPYVSHAHENWEFFSLIFSEAIPARNVATSLFLFEYVFLPARKISNLMLSSAYKIPKFVLAVASKLMKLEAPNLRMLSLY